MILCIPLSLKAYNIDTYRYIIYGLPMFICIGMCIILNSQLHEKKKKNGCLFSDTIFLFLPYIFFSLLWTYLHKSCIVSLHLFVSLILTFFFPLGSTYFALLTDFKSSYLYGEHNENILKKISFFYLLIFQLFL